MKTLFTMFRDDAGKASVRFDGNYKDVLLAIGMLSNLGKKMEVPEMMMTAAVKSGYEHNIFTIKEDE